MSHKPLYSKALSLKFLELSVYVEDNKPKVVDWWSTEKFSHTLETISSLHAADISPLQWYVYERIGPTYGNLEAVSRVQINV